MTSIPAPLQNNLLLYSLTKEPDMLFQSKTEKKILLLILSAMSLLGAISQKTRPHICNCAPAIYKWRLSYSGTCPPSNVQQGPKTGISETLCHINPENADVTDLTPIRTVMIKIFELDLNLVVTKALTLQNLSLSDGDKFTYTSIVATEPQTIPGGLQMRIVSENALGDLIYNDWIVKFTNNCDAEPFRVEDSMGWSEIHKLVPPRDDLCSSVATIPLTEIPIAVPSPSSYPNRLFHTKQKKKHKPTSSPSPKFSGVANQLTSSPMGSEITFPLTLIPKPQSSPLGVSFSYDYCYRYRFPSEVNNAAATVGAWWDVRN